MFCLPSLIILELGSTDDDMDGKHIQDTESRDVVVAAGLHAGKTCKCLEQGPDSGSGAASTHCTLTPAQHSWDLEAPFPSAPGKWGPSFMGWGKCTWVASDFSWPAASF